MAQHMTTAVLGLWHILQFFSALAVLKKSLVQIMMMMLSFHSVYSLILLGMINVRLYFVQRNEKEPDLMSFILVCTKSK